MDLAKEILSNVGVQLIFVVIAAFLGAVAKTYVSYIKPNLDEFFKKNREGKDTNILITLAEQAVELVEARFDDYIGDDKFEEALEMLSRRLDDRGIDMKEESIRMAIQKGWKTMIGGSSSGDEYDEEETDVTEEDMDDLAESIEEDANEEEQ